MVNVLHIVVHTSPQENKWHWILSRKIALAANYEFLANESSFLFVEVWSEIERTEPTLTDS